MSPNEKIAILSIGTELMLGEVVDTNAAFISAHLAQISRETAEVRVVPDNLEVIVKTMGELCEANSFLLITGGLGPTEDDLTRQALAIASGGELEESEQLLAMVEERFKERNLVMAERNKCQALLPLGAAGILNPLGTAPGVKLRVKNCLCFALPGVPVEMKRMLTASVLPAIGRGKGKILQIKHLKLFGLGESTVGQKLSDLMKRGRNPEIGTIVGDSIIKVRLKAEAASIKEAQAMLAADEDVIRTRLGQYVFAVGDATLAEAVVRQLAGTQQTLAVAESCTGGWIGKMLTDVSGSSAVFKEGFITYCNQAKISRLGVDEQLLAGHGAVSEEAAKAMAKGAREAAGTDYGIAVTGIAGPGGGRVEKPVGTVHLAVSSSQRERHQCHNFAMDRRGNRIRAVNTALGLLLKFLHM